MPCPKKAKAKKKKKNKQTNQTNKKEHILKSWEFSFYLETYRGLEPGRQPLRKWETVPKTLRGGQPICRYGERVPASSSHLGRRSLLVTKHSYLLMILVLFEVCEDARNWVHKIFSETIWGPVLLVFPEHRVLFLLFICAINSYLG